MERQIQPDMVIDDGVHQGIIISVEERTKPYQYIDVNIEFEEGKKIKAGFPDFVSPSSLLGILLSKFGADLQDVGANLDIDKILIGKKVEFQTLKAGKYANIVKGSLKPTDAQKVAEGEPT